MTTETGEKPIVRRPETGWSKARRLKGKRALRTWVPAVEDRSGRTPQAVQEGNIVRGED
ncbi:hypothetical protein [Streptomyces sp. S.PNR 29]|uniref:hypothetical protein n=1 Tax=Streptomyces sp. S.PNR 29 TaxID=2973805 RepID=UPI0025B1BC90|nr:hypothetical protein [Streptomyces sp. S.PNR 29]MDN0197783.1 hypothetical protein [Streptomyces sp. S.PNR 29]